MLVSALSSFLSLMNLSNLSVQITLTLTKSFKLFVLRWPSSLLARVRLKQLLGLLAFENSNFMAIKYLDLGHCVYDAHAVVWLLSQRVSKEV